MFDDFKKKMEEAPIRIMKNVGSLFDIPTSTFLEGKRGETIVAGGLPGWVGIAGMPNTFKSTIGLYLMLSAANHMLASFYNKDEDKYNKIRLHLYDTEDSSVYGTERLNRIASRFEYLPSDLIASYIWSMVTKSVISGDEWAEKIMKTLKEKANDKSFIYKLEWLDNKFTGNPATVLLPSFIMLDSYTEFEAESTMESITKDIDNSQTVFMQQGLFKKKFGKMIPNLSTRSGTDFITTSHIGDEIAISQGPFSQPKKILQYMKQGQKIKGVSDSFLFLTNQLWLGHMNKPLINQNTKQPEYPLREEDVSTDLNTVELTLLRSKSGASGITITLVLSQSEGLLPTLTEFHYIKENKFGLEGNLRFYNTVLYPDVKLSRTTVRKLIDSDPKLRRAINILAELHQFKIYKKSYQDLYMEPDELYAKIKEKGYNWDYILSNTRSWWTLDNYREDLPKFLSIVDLLKMAKGEYTPWWSKEAKK